LFGSHSKFIVYFVRLTTPAISGEAHRDGQSYHVGRILVVYTGSEWSVAGFVRFIAGLAAALPAQHLADCLGDVLVVRAQWADQVSITLEVGDEPFRQVADAAIEV
jgi:hypothetical protein